MRRKRVLAWTLAAVLAGTGTVLALPAAKGVAVAAEESESAGEVSGKCGENVYYTFKDGVLTISGTGKMWDFEMEGAIYEAAPEGSILTPWYGYRDDITSIIIEDGVTSIGDYAFFQGNYGFGVAYRNLQNISLTDDITEIGDYAMSGVDGKDFSFPKSLRTIGKGAFETNSEAQELIIPEGVVSIGDGAFADWRNLQVISLPSTLTSIGEGMCYGLNVKEIRISDANPDYYLADGVLYSRDNELILFPGGRGDTSYTVIDGTIEIGAYAFYFCENLKNISFPDSLREIGGFAFENCSLSEFVIPDSVECVGEYAFCWDDLKKVTIGKNVKYIGEAAFDSSFEGTDFYFRGDCPIYVEGGIYGNGDQHSGSIFYLYGRYAKVNNIYYPINNPTWTEENINRLDGYRGDNDTVSKGENIPYQPEGLKGLAILEGANGSCQTDAQSGYRIRIDEELAKFVSVSIDGTPVPEDCYTVESGSTVLTFKPEYLKTLHTGVHTVLITFTSGTAETTLTLTQPQEPSQNPSHNDEGAGDNHANDTGESLPLVLLYGLLAGAGIGFGTWSKRKAA